MSFARRGWILSFIAGAFAAVTIGVTATPADPDPTALPLLYQDNVNYVGAFRPPLGPDEAQSFAFGGHSVSYWPAHNSLLLVGHASHQLVGEISIPTPGTGATVGDLPRASFIQNLTEILGGRRLTVDGNTHDGVRIGGILPTASSLIVSVWDVYDSVIPSQSRSHFVTGQDFSNLGAVQGPFQVGTGYSVGGATHVAGFVAGFMTPIPTEWQAALGGPALTGQSGDISIIGRTSWGPAVSVFRPSDLGVTSPAPAVPVLGYPGDHPTLGVWGQPGGIFDGGQTFRGVVFPSGTRSVLFYGHGGPFCYGEGTPNQALHGRPTPDGSVYCYDGNANANYKGVHNFPSKPMVWAYDANDLVAVKNGTKKPWDLRPYATWTFTLPFQSRIVNGLETGDFTIIGAAYDPATHRVFLSSAFADGASPIIHVLQLSGVGAGLCR